MTRQYITPLIISIMTIIGVFGFSRFIVFGDYIPNETVQIIGKIIIEVSATLIGFWGVILVFQLREIHVYRDNINNQTIEYFLRMKDVVNRKEIEDKTKQKIIDQQIKLEKKWFNETWMSYQKKSIEWANKGIRLMCYMGMGIVGIFVLCIFSSLALMSSSMSASLDVSEFVEYLGTSGLQMSIPLILLASGIIYIFMAMLLIVPAKPKHDSNP